MVRNLGERRLPRGVWLTGGLFVAFVISFSLYVFSEKQIDHANEQRYLSYKLADQLRQSSDDLTRMVRTYVVTGEPIYKQSYLDILDIRDGLRPQPENYDRIYWDLALLDPHFRRPDLGPGIPLLEQMRRAGFTAEEFRTLAEAKASSDELTNREFEAMALVESAGPDRADRRMRAVLMLHDDVYHRAKRAIMTPINAFYDLVETRTLATVHQAETIALVFRLTFIALTVAVGALIWQTAAESRAILGGTVQDVHARITRIGQGDFSPSPSSAKGDSVLAGLDQMAAKLATLEAERILATAELRDMNEALLRSNSDLEQFAYVASHDLQTPLRNIVSYTQLLERRYKGQMDADADDFMGFIVENTKKMTQLISDLLEYSRASGQAEPLEPVPADVAVAQALNNLKQDVASSGADIRIGDLPRVMAVQSHLVSLFQNLLENGIKYRSPDRRARISVTAELIAPDQWRFAVADNGIGIDPQYHAKVFEIFQRLNPASETTGTGIGLTLCRRIVHRFGGTIWVDSELDKGATFFFTLRDAEGE